MMEIQVRSSHGMLIVDGATGDVKDYWLDGTAPKEYYYIVRVDVEEFNRTYAAVGHIFREMGDVDILDVGYWLKDGTYEPPAEVHREHVMEGLKSA